MTLVERVISTAARVGIDDFCVVTGFQAERIEAALADMALRRGLRITPVRNERWPEGNGTSALCARQLIDDEFVLIMGDHIFDEQILARLCAQAAEPGGVVVAADYRVGADGIADDADATKLLVDGDRVVKIGKCLEPYNAYDTGAFLCTPAVFDALAATTADGDGSLSGGMQRLAGEGRVRAVSIGDTVWVDVDTAADARRAQRFLRSNLAKPEDGLVSRMVNRPVSGRVLTPLLLRLWPGVTANAVSFLGLLVALAAAGGFAAGWPALAGVLVALSSILDGSDGEIARLKHLRSSFGGYFDAVVDRYGDTAMLAAATLYARHNGGEWVVAFGTAAVVGNLMVSYTSARSVVDLGYRYGGRWLAAGRGRDLRLFVLSVAAITAQWAPVAVTVALALLAVLTNGIVVARMALSWKLVRPFPSAEVDAIVFDLDGTIADTMPFLTDLAIAALARYDLEPDVARRRYLATVGIDFAAQLEELFPHHPANAEVAAEFEAKKRAGVLECPPFPDVGGTLAGLRAAGVRCFLVSSTAGDLVAAYLDHHGLAAAFDDYIGFEPGLTKDRQVERLVAAHALPPDRTVFVGDAIRDGELIRRTEIDFVGLERLFPGPEFRRRGLRSVANLAAFTRSWQADARRRLAVSPTAAVRVG